MNSLITAGYPLILVAVVLAGCSSTDEAVPAAGAGGLSLETIEYSPAFFPEERDASGASWRWMGPKGVIRFRNTHQDMVLTIAATVPAELAEGATISYTFNGMPLDMIPDLKGLAAKRYDIGPALQGSGDWSELLIETNRPFVPAKLLPNSVDTRSLGAAISEVSWVAR